MHHFSHEDKIKLYSKIFDALKAGFITVKMSWKVENVTIIVAQK